MSNKKLLLGLDVSTTGAKALARLTAEAMLSAALPTRCTYLRRTLVVGTESGGLVGGHGASISQVLAQAGIDGKGYRCHRPHRTDARPGSAR